MSEEHQALVAATPTAQQVMKELSASIGRKLLALLLTGVLGAAGILVATYVQIAVDRANNVNVQAQQRGQIDKLEQDMDELDDGLNDIRANVSAIKGTVEGTRADTSRRLDRIEQILDELSRRRR